MTSFFQIPEGGGKCPPCPPAGAHEKTTYNITIFKLQKRQLLQIALSAFWKYLIADDRIPLAAV